MSQLPLTHYQPINYGSGKIVTFWQVFLSLQVQVFTIQCGVTRLTRKIITGQLKLWTPHQITSKCLMNTMVVAQEYNKCSHMWDFSMVQQKNNSRLLQSAQSFCKDKKKKKKICSGNRKVTTIKAVLEPSCWQKAFLIKITRTWLWWLPDNTRKPSSEQQKVAAAHSKRGSIMAGTNERVTCRRDAKGW